MMKKIIIPILGCLLFWLSCESPVVDGAPDIHPEAKEVFATRQGKINQILRDEHLTPVSGGTNHCSTRLIGGSQGQLFVYYVCEAITADGQVASGKNGAVMLEYIDKKIASVQMPRDGDYYAEDLATIFPRDVIAYYLNDPAQLSRLHQELSRTK